MASLDPNQVVMWEGLISQAVSLGVKSFVGIRQMMKDSGADDALIDSLEIKYNYLYDDVKRSAGLT